MKKDIILGVLLIAFAVLFRTELRLGTNIEFITTASTFAAVVFHDKRLAFLVPILSMLISDSIIGNTNIYLFTWSGFLIVPIVSFIYKKAESSIKLDNLVVPSITSNLLFFFWTNFGVLVTTNMYSKDFNGLMQSYYMGLPFLRNQIIGTIFFSIALFSIYKFALKLVNYYKINEDIYQNWR